MARRKTAVSADNNEAIEMVETAVEEKTETPANVKEETEEIESEIIVSSDDSKTENKNDKYIYVGVSLPGIKSNTVITGKIPEILNVPFIRELVIPIERFTDFLKNKANTESRAAFCYRKSAEYAKTLTK